MAYGGGLLISCACALLTKPGSHGVKKYLGLKAGRLAGYSI